MAVGTTTSLQRPTAPLEMSQPITAPVRHGEAQRYAEVVDEQRGGTPSSGQTPSTAAGRQAQARVAPGPAGDRRGTTR